MFTSSRGRHYITFSSWLMPQGDFEFFTVTQLKLDVLFWPFWHLYITPPWYHSTLPSAPSPEQRVPRKDVEIPQAARRMETSPWHYSAISSLTHRDAGYRKRPCSSERHKQTGCREQLRKLTSAEYSLYVNTYLNATEEAETVRRLSSVQISRSDRWETFGWITTSKCINRFINCDKFVAWTASSSPVRMNLCWTFCAKNSSWW